VRNICMVRPFLNSGLDLGCIVTPNGPSSAIYFVFMVDGCLCYDLGNMHIIVPITFLKCSCVTVIQFSLEKAWCVALYTVSPNRTAFY
jgi:hypothetical protein